MPRIVLRLVCGVSFVLLFSVFLVSVAFADNAGSFTNRSSTFNNLDLVQLAYYSDTGCSTLLGTGGASTALTSVPFADGQFYQINSTAAYQIATFAAITASGIRCIEATLEDTGAGHTYLVVGTGNKPQFQVICSDGSQTCISSSTVNVE